MNKKIKFVCKLKTISLIIHSESKSSEFFLLTVYPHLPNIKMGSEGRGRGREQKFV